MPRPIQLPLAAWLLWQDPTIRLPFAAIFVLHVALVLASGAATDSIAAALDFGASGGLGIRPARNLGRSWMIVGLPLAALLFWRGLPVWSGLALSISLLPQYLLMPLVDLARVRTARRVSSG